jgi:hypothetical protein
MSALGIVLISIASLAVTVLRRRRMQRRLTARIAARLAALAAGPDSPDHPLPASAGGGSATT